jgi:tripartite-type tricarboxylate transporter receptor subunit TctC
MRSTKKNQKMLFGATLILASLVSVLSLASAQGYPDKPITIYCGYEAGASSDLTTRALAKGAEKLLGVPVIVENKAGASASICAALLASKAPDGYTLGSFDTVGAVTARPHFVPVSYKPLEDFTWLIQYGRYTGGICVHPDSPFKTIDELIAYAKANPGKPSYSSSGMYSRSHIGVENFAQCKGLIFKHVPYKGGAPANTALLGKHVDFTAGAGSHVIFVRQGSFRMLLQYSVTSRDPKFPDIPMVKDLGCEDIPPNRYIVSGPKGMPDAIVQKLSETFKNVTEGPDFQKVLDHLDIPYEFRDHAPLVKIIRDEYAWYKTYRQKVGGKK